MKKYFKKLGLKIFSLILLLALAVSNNAPLMNTLALGPSSVNILSGIDVSVWQGDIDFAKVSASGVKVVYMRACYGDSAMDRKFVQNYTNAKAQGLKIGAYHYVTAMSVEQAKSQAKFFAGIINGLSWDCRPVMDFESFGSLTIAEINAISMAYITTLEKETGLEPVVYSNTNTAKNILYKDLTRYPLWVAHYGVEAPKENGKWNYWIGFQYTSTGRVDGISGNVDLDKFTDGVLLSNPSHPTPFNLSLTASESKNVVTLSWLQESMASMYNVKITSLESGEVVYQADSVKDLTIKTLLPKGRYNAVVVPVDTIYQTCGNEIDFTVATYTAPISVDTHGFILSEGETGKINATVTPESFTSFYPLVFESSDKKVATVDQSGNIKAVGIGSAVIKLSVGGFTLDCAVTVRKPVDYTENIKAYRFYGTSRFDTAVNISEQGWASAETVILANGMNFADALSGVPLSKALDAPILLTQGTGALEADVLARIKALDAKNIVILGGEMVISKSIESSLSSYNVNRIYGKTRYETCIEIAKEIEKQNSEIPDTVILSTGLVYADALSISTYAAKYGYPIIYVDPKYGVVDEAILGYMNERTEIQNIIVIGGTNAVTQSQVETLSAQRNVERIAGVSRYDTSLQIYDQFSDEFGHNMFFATGENFPDALSGASLAAKWNSSMLLANPRGADSETKKYLSKIVPNEIYMLGGGDALPAQSVVDSFRD